MELDQCLWNTAIFNFQATHLESQFVVMSCFLYCTIKPSILINRQYQYSLIWILIYLLVHWYFSNTILRMEYRELLHHFVNFPKMWLCSLKKFSWDFQNAYEYFKLQLHCFFPIDSGVFRFFPVFSEVHTIKWGVQSTCITKLCSAFAYHIFNFKYSQSGKFTNSKYKYF